MSEVDCRGIDCREYISLDAATDLQYSIDPLLQGLPVLVHLLVLGHSSVSALEGRVIRR